MTLKVKATNSLFPIEMIAKLERTQRTAQQNKDLKHTKKEKNTNNEYDSYQRIINNKTTVLELTAAGNLDLMIEISRQIVHVLFVTDETCRDVYFARENVAMITIMNYSLYKKKHKPFIFSLITRAILRLAFQKCRKF